MNRVVPCCGVGADRLPSVSSPETPATPPSPRTAVTLSGGTPMDRCRDRSARPLVLQVLEGERRFGSCLLKVRSATASEPGNDVGGRPLVLSFDGELDAYSAPIVRATCFGLLDDCDEARIDLGGVTFIDSAGARFLEQCYERLDGRAARCELQNPTAVVRRIFGILEIDRLIGSAEAVDRSEHRVDGT